MENSWKKFKQRYLEENTNTSIEGEQDTLTNDAFELLDEPINLSEIDFNIPLIYPRDKGFLGDNEFRRQVKHIIVEDGTKIIPNSAFYYCLSLISIEIPSSVISIGTRAFYDCPSLTSVTIPDSVASIGEMAFYDCSSLKSITISNNVTKIGNYAFSSCTSLKSITIPDSVNEIGVSAFYHCRSLTSITIPNIVNEIGHYAFTGCSSLKSIILPSSVTSIGNNAFSGCPSLTIYAEATSRPTGWNTNWNPNNRPVVWNYKNPIKNNENKLSEDVLELLDEPEVLDEPVNLSEIDFNTPIIYPRDKSLLKDDDFKRQIKHIIVEEGTNTIDEGAFSYFSSLESITIPDSVVSIGNSAFFGCPSLTSIMMPDSVTSIGELAFYYCSSLTSVTIPSSVTTIGAYAFYGCLNLTVYVEATSKPAGWDVRWSPENMPVVWNYKNSTSSNNINESKADEQKLIDFAGNSLAKRFLSIKKRLKSPENDIYYWLKKDIVELEDRVNEIENTVSKTKQKEIDKTEGAELVAEKDGWKVYRIDSYEASCLYGKGTKWCTASTETSKHFKDYKDKGIVLYYFIKNNEKYALALYPQIVGDLEKYGIKSNFELYDAKDKLITGFNQIKGLNLPEITGIKLTFETLPTKIENGVLVKVYPYNQGEFVIPDSVTSIGEWSFSDCTSLTSITIPSSVTSIGDYAFYDCYALTSITIPSSVTSIGDYAFSYCESLTSITIPSSVTSIGDSAFVGCYALTSITIPSSVTSIGDSAFYDCPSLTIYAEATSKPTGWGADWNLYNRPVIWNYKNSTKNNENKLNEDNEDAFELLDEPVKLTEIDFNTPFIYPRDKGLLGDNDSRKQVKHIIVEDGVDTILGGAFSGYTSLTSITIPDSVTSIGIQAFFYCESLTSITIPNSVTSIGDWAFSDCHALTSITIPNSVTSISDSAFGGCTSLTVYAEASSKPTGWSAVWNPNNRPVVWNYKNSTSSNNINEESIRNGYDKLVYRVDLFSGDRSTFKDKSVFFADSLEYFNYSDTGYSKEEAKEYYLNLKDFKVFDPMTQWKNDIDVETWSIIRTSEEFANENDLYITDYLDEIDYEDPNVYHEVLIDTDSLAEYGRQNGYDVTILRDIASDGGRGPLFTEYAVHNSNAVKIKDAKVFNKKNYDINEDKRVSTVYLYRGTSERSFSKHYEKISGLFFGIKKKYVTGWGDVKRYTLDKNAKIFEGKSSDEFCISYYDRVYPELNKYFGMYFSDVNKLNDFIDLPQEKIDDIEKNVNRIAGNKFCWYDVWTWCLQTVAKIELAKQGYGGAKWTGEDWGNPVQYQIWNLNVVHSNDNVIESGYNNKINKDSDDDIELPELDDVSIEEITKVLKKKYKISPQPAARCYIMLNGDFLALDGYNSHNSVQYYLIDQGVVKDSPELHEGGCPTLEEMGAIRCNLLSEGFIMLSQERPTQAQYDSLIKLLDEFLPRRSMWRFNQREIMLLTPHQKTDFKFFDVVDNTSDDIVRIIKNYYDFGKLTEGFDLQDTWDYHQVANNIVADFENLYTDDISYCEANIIDDWGVGCDIENGRNMGTYDTKEDAEKRLKQVHYFKHVNEETFNKDIEIPTPISRENLPDEVICYRTITNDEFYRLFSGDVIEGQWIPDDNDWVHFDNLTDKNTKIILFYTDYYRFRIYKNRITLKCKFNKKDIVAVAKGRYAVAKNFNKTKVINKKYYHYNDDMVFLDEIGVLSYDLSNVLEIVSIKGAYSTNEFPHIFNSDINAKLKQNADKYNIKYDNIKENLNEDLKEEVDDRDIYYRGYDSRYGVFDSDNEYGQLYTWVTDEPEYALEYAENNEYGKVAKVRITCSDDEIGGVLDLPDDVDYYDPGDEEFQECILDQGLKGYGFEAGDYDDYCICISKDCVEVIEPDVEVEVEDESLNESKADQQKFIDKFGEQRWTLDEAKEDVERFTKWAGKELADRYFKQKSKMKPPYNDITWVMKNYVNKEDFEEDVYYYEQIPTRSEINKKGKEGAKLIYSDKNWKVYKIDTYEAAVKYGKNTQWCLTGTNTSVGDDISAGREHYNKYVEDGYELYFYIYNKNNDKYALIYANDNDWQLFDSADFLEVCSNMSSPPMDTWNPQDTQGYHPDFPKVKGLPDINKVYDDYAKEVGIFDDTDNDTLDEAVETNSFTPYTAGYILEDGSLLVMDEYHGEEEIREFYPEYSNTHPEEDTCVRIYIRPNEAQYKRLEEIIDYYLDHEGYCKVEIWEKFSGKYNFYEVYSLYEGACEDTTWNEKIGNWTGYKLVQIIKNYFAKRVIEGTIKKSAEYYTPDENQIAFKKTGAKMKESLKSKGNITDKKIIKYVEECIDTLNKLGFKIEDDLELHQGDSLRTFGTFSFPKDGKSSPKLTLNKYMFEEPEESIKNTIYHELCHYLVYKDGVEAGVYFYANLPGKWKYNTTALKKYPANFWKSHGKKWKEYADRVGRAVGHDITRTGSYATHTGVGQQYDKSVKYVVKCNNCNNEIKYTKRTEFVKDPNVIGRSGHYKWSCGKCKAKGQWSVKEVSKDEQ